MQFRAEAFQHAVEPASEVERRRIRQTIQELAQPRMTGSEGAAEVESKLRARFDALGYKIRDMPFHFSTWPGRYGLVTAGVLLTLATLAALILLIQGNPATALVELLVTGAILALLAVLGPRAVRRLGLGQTEGVNLLMSRPGSSPRYIVMAHRDSKSQLVSALTRTIAIVAAVLGWLGLIIAALLVTIYSALSWTGLIVGAGVLALAGSVPLAFSAMGNDSPGALDNASGLAALLALAHREAEGPTDVAFLVTDAEEFGLAGARAVHSRLEPPAGVINLDGLDDKGEFRVIERHGWPRRGLAPRLMATLLGSAGALNLRIRRGDLPVGMLLDHLPFAENGLPAVSIMRGTVGTLLRVHRPSDTPDRLEGDGAAAAMAVVSGSLRLLRESDERAAA